MTGQLETERQLVRNFTAYTRREAILVATKETTNGAWVALGELAQRPRHGFDDHVVAIVDEQLADCEGSWGVAFNRRRATCTNRRIVPTSRQSRRRYGQGAKRLRRRSSRHGPNSPCGSRVR